MNRTSPSNPAHPANANQYISVGNRRVERIWHHEEPLFESTRERLINDASNSMREICGLIDSDHGVHYIENAHEIPEANFFFDKDDYELALEEIFECGNQVLGVWHTHPSGIVWPSPRDIRGWPDPKLEWRYFIATPREVLEWALA